MSAFRDILDAGRGDRCARSRLQGKPASLALADMVLRKQSKKVKFDSAVTKQFRSDVLAFAKAAERIRDLSEIKTLKDSARGWAGRYEVYLATLRKDIESRQYGRNPIDKREVEGRLKYLAPAWDLLLEVRGIPGEPEVRDRHGNPFQAVGIDAKRDDLIQFWIEHGESEEKAKTEADNYLLSNPPWSLEEAEQRAFGKWEPEAKKWAARVRRKARKAWDEIDRLTQWAESWHGGNEPVVVIEPETRRVSMEGFDVVFKGFEDSPYQEEIGTIREGLKLYRKLASQRAPFLLKYNLPIIVQWTSEPTAPRNAAAFYDNGKIYLTPWTIHKDLRDFVRVMAHETGHHVYRLLSRDASNAWSRFIRSDYRDLDLRETLRTLRSLSAKTVIDDKVRDTDPILYLQLSTLLNEREYKHWDLFTPDAIEEHLRSGKDVKVRVPTHPITGYAGTNPTEAFCEALGVLVAYGPRAVLGPVRQFLSLVLPGRVKTSSRSIPDMKSLGVSLGREWKEDGGSYRVVKHDDTHLTLVGKTPLGFRFSLKLDLIEMGDDFDVLGDVEVTLRDRNDKRTLQQGLEKRLAGIPLLPKSRLLPVIREMVIDTWDEVRHIELAESKAH